MTNVEELQRALDFPWEKWTVFLHPEQRQLVERDYIWKQKTSSMRSGSLLLQEHIAHLPKRPIGRPPHEVRRFHANFSYRAQSWTIARRVVAKVEWHSGEL